MSTTFTPSLWNALNSLLVKNSSLVGPLAITTLICFLLFRFCSRMLMPYLLDFIMRLVTSTEILFLNNILVIRDRSLTPFLYR